MKRKKKKVDVKIVVLAHFHRYILPVLILVMPLLFHKKASYFIALGLGSIIYAIYGFVGYKLKWKHIYCSMQNSYHEKMTPDIIRWDRIRKRDIYGVSTIFFLLGLVMTVMGFVDI